MKIKMENNVKKRPLTRDDNIPFIVRDCPETRRILNMKPSKESVERGRRIAANFETYTLNK